MPTHILIAEDDPQLARLFQKSLRPYSDSLTLAPNGEAVMSLIHRRRPDILLLDLGLPKINGLSILRYMRADHQFDDTIIMVITGYSPSRLGNDTELADLVLTKPVSVRELVDMIERVLPKELA